MKEKTIFPREEKSEVLFDKILNDPWAYNKLFQTFCNNLFCNDDSEEYKNTVHEKDYQHFYNIYKNLDNNKNMFLAEAYRYSHTYGDDPSVVEQQILERSTGILLIRELPDTVRMKETEAEAYSAVWDLMLELEKNLPMAYIFYGQDSFVEHNEHFDELGIFLPNSIFLRNLEHHVKKAEAIIYAKD